MPNNKLIAICFLFLFGVTSFAQNTKQVEYRTFIYTDPTLPTEIQRVNNAQDDATRGFADNLLNASLNSVKGIGTGYVTSFVDLGVNALANLLTTNSRHKKEWEEVVKAENKWSTHIASVQDVKDFYQKPSTAGALDPMDMSFNGIGCLRTEGNDTVFFLSCHIDREKLHRIVNHSKFELVLDTLIINPYKSNLPNTELPIPFSFDERKNFTISLNIKLTSSWFTEIIEHHSDELLGEFNISIPVTQESLNTNGELRYVRQENTSAPYAIVGESFIVPRSFMGYRDSSGKYKRIWGTGQYKLDIDISETCDLTDDFSKNWKADYKRHKKLSPKNGFFPTVWKTISHQHWDEITRSWVITTLTAPAGVLSNEIIQVSGLSTPKSAVSPSTAAKK